MHCCCSWSGRLGPCGLPHSSQSHVCSVHCTAAKGCGLPLLHTSSLTQTPFHAPPPSLPCQLINKRPLSPDVFELDNKGMHYKMPWGAISSIMNRGTGVALSVGEWGGGCLNPERTFYLSGGG